MNGDLLIVENDGKADVINYNNFAKINSLDTKSWLSCVFLIDNDRFIIANGNKKLLCYSLNNFELLKEIDVKFMVFAIIKIENNTLMIGGEDGNQQIRNISNLSIID